MLFRSIRHFNGELYINFSLSCSRGRTLDDHPYDFRCDRHRDHQAQQQVVLALQTHFYDSISRLVRCNVRCNRYCCPVTSLAPFAQRAASRLVIHQLPRVACHRSSHPFPLFFPHHFKLLRERHVFLQLLEIVAADDGGGDRMGKGEAEEGLH